MDVRNFLPAVSVLGLLGAGAVVTWSGYARPRDAFITPEAVDAFNLQTAPSARPVPGEAMRDAVAAAPAVGSALMRPIGGEGLGGAPKKEPPRKSSAASPKAEAWARRHALLAALVARPASFLASRSALRGARDLRVFLASPAKVDAYLNSPLVRVALNNPSIAKVLLGNMAVVRAVLATPAMRDRASVEALLSSPMVRKMRDCPGIKGALEDPALLPSLAADPAIGAWLTVNPRALMVVSGASS